MSSGPQAHGPDVTGRGRMFWLPPDGSGNGLEAPAWAEIADMTEGEASVVVDELTAAHVPAYLATPHPHGGPAGATPTRRRLWVDSTQYRRAEDIVMLVLARLHHTPPPRPPP